MFSEKHRDIFSVIVVTFARGSTINLFLKAGAAGCG